VCVCLGPRIARNPIGEVFSEAPVVAGAVGMVGAHADLRGRDAGRKVLGIPFHGTEPAAPFLGVGVRDGGTHDGAGGDEDAAELHVGVGVVEREAIE
jgi:hypothetical protein